MIVMFVLSLVSIASAQDVQQWSSSDYQMLYRGDPPQPEGPPPQDPPPKHKKKHKRPPAPQPEPPHHEPQPEPPRDGGPNY